MSNESGMLSSVLKAIAERNGCLLYTSQRGDQHIVVTVQTPKKLTDTQRELLLRFANESNEDVNNLQVSKSLFEKIKDCLTK